MNLFLNENWKEIFAELKPVIEDTFGELIRNIVNNVFNTFPYDTLFRAQRSWTSDKVMCDMATRDRVQQLKSVRGVNSIENK